MKKCSTVIACKRNCFDFWNSCKRLQNFVNVEALTIVIDNLLLYSFKTTFTIVKGVALKKMISL